MGSQRVGHDWVTELNWTLCKIVSGNLLWLRELKPGLRDDLEGWDGVGGGREVQEGTYVHLGWLVLMYGRNQRYCRAIILQLKINKFLKAVLIHNSLITIEDVHNFVYLLLIRISFFCEMPIPIFWQFSLGLLLTILKYNPMWIMHDATKSNL